MDCGMTTGVDVTRVVRPCSLCGGGNLVKLGRWEPQPGLVTVYQLFDRGRLTSESTAFGQPVTVRGFR
jgi:hypothetical protein